MDLISQLQDHTNHIAFILFDTIGTLQRDAQPSPIPGKKLPDPPPADPAQSSAATAAATPGVPPAASAATPSTGPASGRPGVSDATPAGTADGGNVAAQVDPAQAAASFAEDVSARAAALVKALKLFDDMVAALLEEVDFSEEEILKQIAQVHEENETVGLELSKELELAEIERRNVAELFTKVAAHALNGT